MSASACRAALARAAVLLIAAASAASCSAGAGQRVVLASPPSGHGLFYRVHTDEPVDIIIWFQDIASSPVHLTRLSLPGHAAAVRLIGTSIYDERRVGYNPATALGILPDECPGKFIPRRPGTLTVQPGRQSPWFGVVTLRITRPGRYQLDKIKISYTAGNSPGWQYYNDPVLLIVSSNPPRPGPRPLPSDVVCQ